MVFKRGHIVPPSRPQEIKKSLAWIGLNVFRSRCQSLIEKGTVIAVRYESYSAATQLVGKYSAPLGPFLQSSWSPWTETLNKLWTMLVLKSFWETMATLRQITPNGETRRAVYWTLWCWNCEHGTESIHAECNSLLKTFSNVVNGVEWLRAVLKHHCLATLPKHSSEMATVPTQQ